MRFRHYTEHTARVLCSICDSSEELRALREKLHQAKVNKERAAQLLEIQIREEEERVRKALPMFQCTSLFIKHSSSGAARCMLLAACLS